jgi:hypothetical protein
VVRGRLHAPLALRELAAAPHGRAWRRPGQEAGGPQGEGEGHGALGVDVVRERGADGEEDLRVLLVEGPPGDGLEPTISRSTSLEARRDAASRVQLFRDCSSSNAAKTCQSPSTALRRDRRDAKATDTTSRSRSLPSIPLPGRALPGRWSTKYSKTPM